MSKKEQRRLEAANRKQEAESGVKKVFMRFPQNQYYNDQTNPIFEKGKIYELEGASWIQRWLKRGGEILTEEQMAKEKAKAEAKPSKAIVDAGENGVVKIVGESEKKEDEPEAKIEKKADGEIRAMDGGSEEIEE